MLRIRNEPLGPQYRCCDCVIENKKGFEMLDGGGSIPTTRKKQVVGSAKNPNIDILLVTIIQY